MSSAAGLLKYFAFRSAQLALKRKREGVVYSEKGVLSQQACEVLRRAVDSHASTAPEPADGLPLEQLDLSAAQLEQMIGRDAAHALWRLPRRFAEQGGLVAAGAASGHGSSKADSVPVAPYSIFVRRYSAESRPFFRLHADNSVVTVNVALLLGRASWRRSHRDVRRHATIHSTRRGRGGRAFVAAAARGYAHKDGFAVLIDHVLWARGRGRPLRGRCAVRFIEREALPTHSLRTFKLLL